MTVGFVSSNYLGTALLPAVGQADLQLTKLQTESASGQYADLGLQLGGQSGYELSLRNADDLLQTVSTSNTMVNGRLTTASDALSSILTTAKSTQSTLVAWTPYGAASGDVAVTGDDALQSLAASANSSYGGDYVFGGINTATAPMASYTSSSPAATALQSAFQTQFGCLPSDAAAASISSTAMTSFLAGAFDDQFTGANWTSNWSSASSVNSTAEVAPGQTVTSTASLNSGGFADLAQGYAMLSMLGGSELSSGAQQSVVTAATNLLTTGISSLTSTAAGIGQTQDVIKQADDDMTTQMTLLQTQLGGLDNVNQEQVSTQLTTLTTQIEAAYQITAQLQKLSLAQYLPA